MQTMAYSRFARLLHWGMAVLILLTLPAGLLMVQQGINREVQNALFLYHKNVGVLLWVLVLVRLVWRLRNPAPPFPPEMPASQVRIAELTHGLLYLLMIAVPMAGYIRVRAGGFPVESLDALGLPTLVPRSDALAALAKSVHYFSGLAIAALLTLHIAAALYHRILRRDRIFERMWPTGSTRR